MRVHELKTEPKYFMKIEDGSKSFELRKNDRDFRLNDILHLREHQGSYTGNEIIAQVTYILTDPNYVKRDHAAMAIEVLAIESHNDFERYCRLCKHNTVFNPKCGNCAAEDFKNFEERD